MVDWKMIDTKYPSVLDKENMSKEEYRKQRIIELYSYLPQTTLEERFQYNDIRDAVIEMNYTFFGFIAAHKFINNTSVSYEDKFQSALFHFCEMWHKFKFAAKYRTDLSFGVFFKPRITECMERELNEVKYSLRRTLCMEAGDQLGKHWAKVTYDDLKHVNLPPEKMASLEAMFGSMYVAELDTSAMFIAAPAPELDDLEYYSDNYDSITDMLIHEMVIQEKDLEDSDLLNLAIMLDIPFATLKETYPKAKEKLYKELQYKLEIKSTFG